MSQKFKRTVEDFTCEHCGKAVLGDGYTNHCPECLWSKHVDTYPGDRASTCLGLMQPVEITSERGEERIVHACVKCGYRKPNRVHEKDSREALLRVARGV